ncbi:hypothetical protein V1512DRAFT_259688 [Lipomyces arxii]|uniref:uncharacterized protein n=1 Tax=Lipomyces arxii TaxID=56418 RepID=UPI0034CE84BC
MSTPSWLAVYNKPGSAVVKKNTSYGDPAAFDKEILLASKHKHGSKPVGPSAEEKDDLKVKKAWEFAMSPGQSLPMNAIMSYFSGSTLQIFSITMTFMLFSNPFKAIVGVNQAFARYEGENTFARVLQAKLVFIALQLGTVAVGIYKMSSMGILPTKRSDWLAFEQPTSVNEFSVLV